MKDLTGLVWQDCVGTGEGRSSVLVFFRTRAFPPTAGRFRKGMSNMMNTAVCPHSRDSQERVLAILRAKTSGCTSKCQSGKQNQWERVQVRGGVRVWTQGDQSDLWRWVACAVFVPLTYSSVALPKTGCLSVRERTDRKVMSWGQVFKKRKRGALPGRETHINNVVGQGLGCEHRPNADRGWCICGSSSRSPGLGSLPPGRAGGYLWFVCDLVVFAARADCGSQKKHKQSPKPLN